MGLRNDSPSNWPIYKQSFSSILLLNNYFMISVLVGEKKNGCTNKSDKAYIYIYIMGKWKVNFTIKTPSHWLLIFNLS